MAPVMRDGVGTGRLVHQSYLVLGQALMPETGGGHRHARMTPWRRRATGLIQNTD